MKFTHMKQSQIVTLLEDNLARLYQLNPKYYALYVCLSAKHEFLLGLLENDVLKERLKINFNKLKIVKLERIFNCKVDFLVGVYEAFYYWLHNLYITKNKQQLHIMAVEGIFEQIKDLMGLSDSEYDYALNLIGLQYVREHWFLHHLSGDYTIRRGHYRYRPVARYAA